MVKFSRVVVEKKKKSGILSEKIGLGENCAGENSNLVKFVHFGLVKFSLSRT